MGWDKQGAEASIGAEAGRSVWHDGKWGISGYMESKSDETGRLWVGLMWKVVEGYQNVWNNLEERTENSLKNDRRFRQYRRRANYFFR